MKTLLILLALSAPAFANDPWQSEWREPQCNSHRDYNGKPYIPRYRQPALYGYSYGPGFYSSANVPYPLYGYSYGPGFFSSAFEPSPIFYGGYGW